MSLPPTTKMDWMYDDYNKEYWRLSKCWSTKQSHALPSNLQTTRSNFPNSAPTPMITHLGYTSTYCPSVEYPIATTTLSKKQCKKIQSKAHRAIIGAHKINRQFLRDAIYGQNLDHIKQALQCFGNVIKSVNEEAKGNGTYYEDPVVARDELQAANQTFHDVLNERFPLRRSAIAPGALNTPRYRQPRMADTGMPHHSTRSMKRKDQLFDLRIEHSLKEGNKGLSKGQREERWEWFYQSVCAGSP